MKKWRRRILGFLVLGAVVWAGGAWFFRHEPVARLALADGTELRLEYVTYGTEHRVPGAGRFGAWLSRQAQRWPGLGVPVYEAEYRYAFEQPELLLWFRYFDPKTSKILSAPLGVLAEAVEGPSQFVEADDLALQNDNNPQVPRMPNRSSIRILNPQVNALPMPHLARVGRVYERRKAELRLRFWEGDSNPMEITIPNPAAGTAFPVWQAEPLPQARRVGELEVVLRSVEAHRDLGGDVAVEPQIEVLHEGRPAEGLEWDEQEWQILDATGNTGSRFNPPPFSEPVWKIRKPFVRTGDFPFAVTEGRVLGPVRMPEAGKCEVLPLSEEDVKKGLRLAVVMGPGYFHWEGGKLVESRVPRPQIEWWTPPAKPFKEGTFVLWSKTPTVFFAYKDQGEFQWGFAYGRAVRLRFGKDGYGLSEGPYEGPQTGFEVRENSLQGIRYALTRRDRSEISEADPNEADEANPGEANPDKAPPAATEIWIQVVPVRMEYLDFPIAPPKVTFEPDEVVTP